MGKVPTLLSLFTLVLGGALRADAEAKHSTSGDKIPG